MNPQKRKDKRATEGGQRPLRSRGEEKKAFTSRERRKKRKEQGGAEI